LKFYEEWCTHCKALKRPFHRAASYFRDKVDFMEIECSSTDATTEFCTRNGVKSYPALMLFTGEDKFKFEEESRNIITFGRFFKKHLTPLAEKRADMARMEAMLSGDAVEDEDDDEDNGSNDNDDNDDEEVEVDLADVGRFVTPTISSVSGDGDDDDASASSAGSATLQARVQSLEGTVSTLMAIVEQQAEQIAALLK
jgi:hypothetical protein